MHTFVPQNNVQITKSTKLLNQFFIGILIFVPICHLFLYGLVSKTGSPQTGLRRNGCTCIYLSILRRISETCTFPRTISAQARYMLCLGSAFINWWSWENASENIWSNLCQHKKHQRTSDPTCVNIKTIRENLIWHVST